MDVDFLSASGQQRIRLSALIRIVLASGADSITPIPSTYAQPLQPDDLGYRSSLSSCKSNYLLHHVPRSLYKQYKNPIISGLLCQVKDLKNLKA